MTSHSNTLGKTIASLAGVVALVAGCSAGTSVAEPTEPVATVSVPVPDSIEIDQSPAVRPTPSAAPAPSLEPPATAVPVAADEVVLVDPTTALGLDPDARYGYFASQNAWFDPVACDAPPQEVLAGVDVQASTSDDVVLFAAGFSASGNVQQMTFSSEGRAAALISCGESTERPWLQIVDFDADGRVASVGPMLSLPETASASGPYLGQWTDNDSVLLYTYPENRLQEVTVAAATGNVVSVEEPTFEERDERRAATWTSTPDGRFRYRVVDDPEGRIGCEGNGFMVTLEVDDGSGPRLAMAHPDQVFASASDLQFGPDNLVTWNSWCEGFATPFVGRTQADGSIADAHFISVFEIEVLTDASTEYRDFRLSTDGFLVAVGAIYRQDSDPQVALFTYDLSADPQLG